ncbi:MAG TPA: uracil-DNA glycosylase [Pyrinomonadaceae bacterium]|nr:uracil-DNA glycosylase [Pyrinomonadaceae bacterium]
MLFALTRGGQGRALPLLLFTRLPPPEQKRALFAALASEAAACRRCAAMCGRTAVLSERNGDPSARVMFIGEAPGRQGGDRTRVPFSGDQSGRNFARYLDSIKLARSRVFITNAVMCNPRKESGANRRPTGAEIKNCSEFLRRQIGLVDPRVVVTLGAVALAALSAVAYHEFTLKESAGRVLEWGGRLLVPLYHPSPQVLASHRREDAQLMDYRAVARAVRRCEALSQRA